MDSGFFQGPPITARYVRFGSLQIDQQRQCVLRDGNWVRLQGKAFAVLMVLVQKQGEAATREELKRALWSTKTYVSFDANLNTTISKLRRVLGESTETVPYIETIPRKGHRFTRTVEFSDLSVVGIERATSATSETIDPDRSQEVRVGEASRSGKSLITMIIALVLVGILLGATAATFWIAHVAPQVHHSASKRFGTSQRGSLFTFMPERPGPFVRPALGRKLHAASIMSQEARQQCTTTPLVQS